MPEKQTDALALLAEQTDAVYDLRRQAEDDVRRKKTTAEQGGFGSEKQAPICCEQP